MLVGQLLALSYLSRLYGPPPGSQPLGKVSAIYIGLFLCVSVISTLVLALPAVTLGISRALVLEELHLWRPITAVLCTEGLGLDFALQLWFFGSFSSVLERRHYHNRPFKYTAVLLSGTLLIGLQALVLGGETPLALSHSLTLFVVTLWSRTEPLKPVSLLHAIPTRVTHMPWFLAAAALPLTGVRLGWCNLFGIVAALLFDALLGMPLPASAKEIRSSSNQAGRLAFGGLGPGGGGKGGKGKLSRAASALRERQARWVQMGACAALVAYHTGVYIAEQRAERSAEMALARRLGPLLSAEGPMLRALLAKFHEGRPQPDAPDAPLDAPSIFALWLFASEHWQQARQQSQPPPGMPSTHSLNVNHLSEADEEATRQLVASALARTELNEDAANDSALVAEVYAHLGLPRLVVTPPALAHFGVALGQYRQSRARTAAALAFIRKTVAHGDDPAQRATDQAAELFSTVHALLTEYALPAHMSDGAVLAELFGLLEVPRDAASYRVEKLLLAAVRAHRRDRAAGAAHTATEALAKVRAVVTNDTQALGSDGKPLLSLDECWRLGASNETLRLALTEALHWLDTTADDEGGGEGEGGAQWRRLLRLANLTQAEVDGGLRDPADGNAPLLGSAFVEVQARRRREARAQLAFDELIATVRAEDPKLAAEEARKKGEQLRHERKRRGWLVKLLRQARARGLPHTAHLPELDAELSGDAAGSAAAAAATLALDGVATDGLAPAAAGADGAAAAARSGGGAVEAGVGGGAAGGGLVAMATAEEMAAEARELDGWDVGWETANVSAWREELGAMQAASAALEVCTAPGRESAATQARACADAGKVTAPPTAQETRERLKHEHYARLFRLPVLIDEALSTWIDPADDLSDKQVYLELLRMMVLPEDLDARLMRAMVEAIKQHRLRREKEELGRGDWAALKAEGLALRPSWRQQWPSPEDLKPAEGLVNVGGDGNDFAIFVASLLHAVGAKVRLSIGCAHDVPLPTAPAEGAPPWERAAYDAARMADPSEGPPATVCQLFAEVRLGRAPSRMAAWARQVLPGSRWLGKAYSYRLDVQGYAWLNLDAIDGHRGQRPGAPYKAFASLTTFYPGSLVWEVEGGETDSAGQPRLKHSPHEQVQMGVR